MSVRFAHLFGATPPVQEGSLVKSFGFWVVGCELPIISGLPSWTGGVAGWSAATEYGVVDCIEVLKKSPPLLGDSDGK